MVLGYSPRISGTRHGFRVRKGMRRCRVRVIVLGCAPGVLSGVKNVLEVRVMVLEYSPRISGTRHGFRVRKGMRRCKVRVIVLGCAPGVLEYAQLFFIFFFFSFLL